MPRFVGILQLRSALNPYGFTILTLNATGLNESIRQLYRALGQIAIQGKAEHTACFGQWAFASARRICLAR
jgi:hypothetical protein